MSTIDEPTQTQAQNDGQPEGQSGDVRARRGFLATLGGICLVWVGALMYPVYRYLSPPPTGGSEKVGKTKIEKVRPEDVAQPGQGKNGGYAGRGLIVLRTDQGELRAFDAKCTHAGCNVSFAGDKMSCPCHGGTYDLHGRNVAGPPPRPLAELSVFEENGELFVDGPVARKA